MPEIEDSNLKAVDLEGSNIFVVSAFTLLSLVPHLRSLPVFEKINALRDRLIGEMKNFENQVLQKGVSRHQKDIAKYLLCAFIDESVLNTPWGSRSGWGHNSLSSILFRKRVGGKEFFQILDRLKQTPSEYLDLLELVYLCLSLGFEGKYRYMTNGQLSLEKERQELYHLIQRSKGDPSPELSTHWQGQRNVTNPLIRHVPLWVLAGISGVILMTVYMVFAFGIRDRSDQLYEQLFTLAKSIEASQPMDLVLPLEVKRPPAFMTDRLEVLLANEIKQKQAAVVDGSTIRIFNMFRSGTATVRNDYQPIMAKIAQAMQKENARLLVVGHTDNIPLKFSSRFKSNWHLSLARAESARNALVGHGFPADRVRIEGKADKDPIVPNNTRENRALNRRVDIYVR
jgi:type VI secretion system protein ImpK